MCAACTCAVHLLASLALGALAITVKRMAFILNAEVQNLGVFLTHDYCWVHQACGSEGAVEPRQWLCLSVSISAVDFVFSLFYGFIFYCGL